MVYFEQHIVLSPTTQVYIGMLILVLSVLVIAVFFAGVMLYRQNSAIRMQNEMLGVGDHVQARKAEGRKKE
jgi:cell division protein FtsL